VGVIRLSPQERSDEAISMLQARRAGLRSRSPRGLRPLATTGSARTLFALTAALWPLLACGKGEQGPPQRPPVPVTVAEVRRETTPLDLAAVGTVEARSTVEVRSRVGGEVMRVHFREGDEVAQGQPLFTIDTRPFQTALAQAQAQLERNQVLAENAAREAARYADLVQKDFVTREQHDRVQSEARALQAGLAADRAAVAEARLQLDYASVRAPISGRAGALLVHAGNNLRANEQTLVVLHEMAPVDVRFAIPQQHLGDVRRRAAASGGAATALEVRVDEGEGARVGRLSFVDNAVDPASGTIQLKATFDNADRGLWPGQLVQVALRLGSEQAVIAPEGAVQSGQRGDYVFVVKADQTVESRPVEVARSVGGRAVIADGLAGGETVVTAGQLRLSPGAKVVVKETAAPPLGAASTPAAPTRGGSR
jgi:multidrug efflux system membrane fusion protein